MEKKGFFSNWIVKNLIGAAALIVILCVAASLFLAIYTHHGEQMSVPDMVSLSQEDARSAAALAGMTTEVADSIYVRKMPRGAVVRQDPAAGTMVKSGRRIQLTINAVAPKKIPMPNLVGYSLRSASAELSARGLTIGRKIYVEDIATNNVLKQIYKNREIKPGTLIPCDAQIDLVLGLNPNDE